MKGLAMRKQKAEQAKQAKLSKIHVLSEETTEVPTLYAEGEPRIAWTAPVPLVKTTITETRKDKWGIERKVRVTAWKHDWRNWEPPIDVDAARQAAKKNHGVKCPRCKEKEVATTVRQMRSADEAPTVFYRCKRCGHKWRGKD